MQSIDRFGQRSKFLWSRSSANYTGDRIPSDIRTMMQSMGGTIEIDEYR
ncbi:hypothetical protein [Caballeronia sp. BR00000012568055]|nr:hypothetical protein [Caballeronia sp. BR00000012568055]